MDDQPQISNRAPIVPAQEESADGVAAVRWTLRETLISLFLVASIVTGYFTVWQMGFVYFDDPGYVNDNLNVLRGFPLFRREKKETGAKASSDSSAASETKGDQEEKADADGTIDWAKNLADCKESIYWAFTSFEQSNWHPLSWLSHMLDIQLYGQWAGGHHITNILLHSMNALLLFWLLMRMTGKVWASAAVAAMFAIHPMHVESVVWVAERKDVLSTFLGFLTMHAYVSYSRRARLDGESLVFSVCAAAIFGMLGWLWYHECFWYQQQLLWFQQLRIPPAADVYERFQQQCQWLKQHNFLVSPDAWNWSSDQSVWLEQRGLSKVLPVAYDGFSLVGLGLLLFAGAFIACVGGVGYWARSSGRDGIFKYCGSIIGHFLVGLVILMGLWSLRAFGGEQTQSWCNWLVGLLFIASVFGILVGYARGHSGIAVQSGIFAATLLLLVCFLNWILLSPPPPKPTHWYQSPFQTVAERMWCSEFAIGLFVAFGSLAIPVVRRRRADIGLFCVVIVLYAVGLLAKPMLVTLPFVLLLIDFWPLGRLDIEPVDESEEPSPAAQVAARSVRRRAKRNQRIPAQVGRAAQRETIANSWNIARIMRLATRAGLLVVEKLPLFAMAAVSGVITPIAQAHGGSMASANELPITFRIQNSLQSFAGYIGRMIWPGKMMSLHLLVSDELGRPYVNPMMVGIAVVVVLLLTAVAIAGLYFGRRYLAFGWFWYVGILIPVIGLVQVGEQSMADRYTYVPYIGLFVAIVWGVSDLLERFRVSRRLAAAGCAFAMAVILAAWISWTNHQVQTWRDVRTHLEHALEVEPDNWNMLNNYGVWLWKESQKQDVKRTEFLIAGDKKAAEECDKESQEFKEKATKSWTHGITSRPTATDIHSNLGYMLSEKADTEKRRGDQAAAGAELAKSKGDQAAAAAKMDEARKHWAAGEASLNDAENHLRAAVNLKAISSRPHNNLGRVLLKRNKIDEAVIEFQESIRLDPSLLEAHLNLATVYRNQQKLDLAEAQYKAIMGYYSASVVDPESVGNFCQALMGLADIAMVQGKGSDAISFLRTAVAIKPTNVDVRRALASTLILQGQRRQAQEQIWILLGLTPNRAEVAEMLGFALDKMNKPDEANFAWEFAAWVFATSREPSMRNGPEAVKLADTVCKRTQGKNAMALDSIAAAFAECGDFRHAVEAATTAVNVANSQGNKPLATAIAQRLQTYRQGKPYRCDLNGSDRP